MDITEVTILHHVAIMLLGLWLLSAFNCCHTVVYFLALIYLYLVRINHSCQFCNLLCCSLFALLFPFCIGFCFLLIGLVGDLEKKKKGVFLSDWNWNPSLDFCLFCCICVKDREKNGEYYICWLWSFTFLFLFFWIGSWALCYKAAEEVAVWREETVKSKKGNSAGFGVVTLTLWIHEVWGENNKLQVNEESWKEKKKLYVK